MTTETPIHDSIAQKAIEATAPRVATLTALDRCDACASGAERAYVRVTFTDATELLFCAHHYAEHEAAIAFHSPLEIVDERWQITQAEAERTAISTPPKSDQCFMGDHRHCPDPAECACDCHKGQRR
jgi:hypothetical protein